MDKETVDYIQRNIDILNSLEMGNQKVSQNGFDILLPF